MSDTIQKDLVLSINEYAYVLDQTKGYVTCLVGPIKMSLSQSDMLVKFDEKSKSFTPCHFNDAKYLFKTAPEGWYIALKNPTKENSHPALGTANVMPSDLQIGRKINVTGPCSFALYPGQMAKIIRGHALRSNQYLLARVYEPDSANNSRGKVLNTDGKEIETKDNTYVNGQLLVIKGTEVSFYIPPTGIEVIPKEDGSGYVRDAVTLERLEYCILKDEDGNKRYVHGPKVVFPKPTETFVTSNKGGVIFRAVELSPISGIYIKVIAEYTDEKKKLHPVGEEMFITGNDQMIYYPRPEHAVISYDGKLMHHAIAIPEGEGRYIMNRLTGEIKTVRGPAMYLPDPRTEVVVKRKLTVKECNLMYPDNEEVVYYNSILNEKTVKKSFSKKNVCSIDNVTSTLPNFETNASISRGTSYTKPRTITLDNKYDGVVTINVWPGYAVSIISKNGSRRIAVGPTTILLDYDETLEPIKVDGVETAYFKYSDIDIEDKISIETSELVSGEVNISYNINFLIDGIDNWFKEEDPIRYIKNKMRFLIRKEFKKNDLSFISRNYTSIVDTATQCPYPFESIGAVVEYCEPQDICIQNDAAEIIREKRNTILATTIELNTVKEEAMLREQIANYQKRMAEIQADLQSKKHEVDKLAQDQKIALKAAANRANEENRYAEENAKLELAKINQEIEDIRLENLRKQHDESTRYETEALDVEMTRKNNYANAVNSIISGISPTLASALVDNSNKSILETLAAAVSPYAMADHNSSVADIVNKLTRGTSLEGLVSGVNLDVKE